MSPLRVGGTPPAPDSSAVNRAPDTSRQATAGRTGRTARGVPVRGLTPAPARGMRATVVAGLRRLRAQIAPPRLAVPEGRSPTQGAVARAINPLLAANVSRHDFARRMATLALHVPDLDAADLRETGNATLESRQAEALHSLSTSSLRRMEEYLFSPHMNATLVALASRGQESVPSHVAQGVAAREDVSALQSDCDGEAAVQIQVAISKLRTALRNELQGRNESPAQSVGYMPTPAEAQRAAQDYLDAVHSLSITSGSIPVSLETIKHAEDELGTLEPAEGVLTADEATETVQLADGTKSRLNSTFFKDLMRCQVVLIDQDGGVTPFADSTLREMQKQGKQYTDASLVAHAEKRLLDFVGGDTGLAVRVSQVAHQGSSLWVTTPSRVGIAGSGPKMEDMEHAYPLHDYEDYSPNRDGVMKRNRHYILADENRHEGDETKGSAFGSTGWRDGMSIAIRKNRDDSCNVVVQYRSRPRFVTSMGAVNYPLDSERSVMENMLNFKVSAAAPTRIEEGRSSWRLMPPNRVQIEKTEIEEAEAERAEAEARARAEAEARAQADGQTEGGGQ